MEFEINDKDIDFLESLNHNYPRDETFTLTLMIAKIAKAVKESKFKLDENIINISLRDYGLIGYVVESIKNINSDKIEVSLKPTTPSKIRHRIQFFKNGDHFDDGMQLLKNTLLENEK